MSDEVHSTNAVLMIEMIESWGAPWYNKFYQIGPEDFIHLLVEISFTPRVDDDASYSSLEPCCHGQSRRTAEVVRLMQ